jgi:hypothetical protein
MAGFLVIGAISHVGIRFSTGSHFDKRIRPLVANFAKFWSVLSTLVYSTSVLYLKISNRRILRFWADRWVTITNHENDLRQLKWSVLVEVMHLDANCIIVQGKYVCSHFSYLLRKTRKCNRDDLKTLIPQSHLIGQMWYQITWQIERRLRYWLIRMNSQAISWIDASELKNRGSSQRVWTWKSQDRANQWTSTQQRILVNTYCQWHVYLCSSPRTTQAIASSDDGRSRTGCSGAR